MSDNLVERIQEARKAVEAAGLEIDSPAGTAALRTILEWSLRADEMPHTGDRAAAMPRGSIGGKGRSRSGGRSSSTTSSPPGAGSKPRARGPMDYIRELAAADFFDTKRTTDDVQTKLEEGAHIYPKDLVGMALYRLVRKGELRRLKEDKIWNYVNS